MNATDRSLRRPPTLQGRLWMLLGIVAASCGPATLSAADRTGELVTTVCQTCHMTDGNSTVPLFPKLAGQQVSYLEKQLEDWLAGERTMEPMTPYLAEVKSRDVGRLAAYYAAQQPAPGVVQDPALAAAGRLVYLDGNEDSGVPACEACHQWNGEGNARYPRLAGQHQAYTIAELVDFREGSRRNDAGRIMGKIAGRMTDAEIAAVAEYIASLSGAPEDAE